jgi:NAD(P)-dependent dehydrogenase (short-subunit alcohol dehydrogenase family)
MTKGMSGKVVWITGASSGIGRALALEAASLGARIILSGRRRAALDEVSLECKARGAQAGAVICFDLESPDARAEACEAAPGLLGPIDVLILNAGMSQRSTFLDTTSEAFDRVMNLDFAAQVDMVRRCLPAMAERGSGTLVAISSIAGLAGAPLRPAYSAAKHAIAGLFQNLRSELVGTGVRVVTAYPGYVRTAVARNALSGDGSPSCYEDPNIEGGADPERVARRILRAALGGSVEPKIGFDLKSRFGLFISRYAPSLWASMSHKHAGLDRP